MQKTKKQIYESLDITVTRVELENPICAGSVDFVGKDENGVTIQSQDVADVANNDFSGSAWEVPATTTE